MGAPEGNQFWKLRSKHGRDKLFESPELLWEAACEYFEWCDNHPLIKVEFMGKDIERVELPLMRAYTWEGLELFLDIFSLRDYKTNPDYKDFSQVIIRIDRIIRTQKFEGAAAGLLNPNIIARDLGLKEQQEINLNSEKQINISIDGEQIDLKK